MSDLPHVPQSLLLQWHVTERCNLRCAHCYQEGPVPAELALPKLLQILAQFTELLASLRKSAEPARFPAHLTLTGGEPFVREDFMELLEIIAAQREAFTFAVLTNGTFIDAARARTLRRLGPRFVQVSVEGTPATHDRIRGSGTFEQTVAAIRALRAEHIPTLISFTAHRGNFREFPEVVRLGRKLGANRVWADRFIPEGQSREAREMVLTPSETREFFQIMRQSRPQGVRGWYGCEVAMHRALQFLMGGGDPYHCTAGDSLLTVLPDGGLCPCRRLPIPVGNLLEQPLQALYQESELFRRLRDPAQISPTCAACCYARLCRGGLKCLAYALHGDPFQPDPGCWAAQEVPVRACQETGAASKMAWRTPRLLTPDTEVSESQAAHGGFKDHGSDRNHVGALLLESQQALAL